MKITLILLFLFLVWFFGGFSFTPKMSEEEQKEWQQYIERVKATRRKLEEAVEESGVVKDYVATVELQTKPWINIISIAEDVAVLYPKTTFDKNCVFKVFYNHDGFVWSSNGTYMSYEYQQKHSEIQSDYYNRFAEIRTYTSEAFNLVKKKITTLNVRVKGLSSCIDAIDKIKIETRYSK